MKNTSAEHGQNIFHGNSMNNLLSYRGLIDAKLRASDKDLPVSHETAEVYKLGGVKSTILDSMLFPKEP